jgi:hypothetical protein
MQCTRSPGPDGFSPAFYTATSQEVKLEVMHFLSAFYEGNVQLQRINRSYMVLIPKKQDANTVDAFRPICLQNCCIRILSKILTTRLQLEINSLVDLDQHQQISGPGSNRIHKREIHH